MLLGWIKTLPGWNAHVHMPERKNAHGTLGDQFLLSKKRWMVKPYKQYFTEIALTSKINVISMRWLCMSNPHTRLRCAYLRQKIVLAPSPDQPAARSKLPQPSCRAWLPLQPSHPFSTRRWTIHFHKFVGRPSSISSVWLFSRCFLNRSKKMPSPGKNLMSELWNLSTKRKFLNND